jgi:hypothetical protein
MLEGVENLGQAYLISIKLCKRDLYSVKLKDIQDKVYQIFRFFVLALRAEGGEAFHKSIIEVDFTTLLVIVSVIWRDRSEEYPFKFIAKVVQSLL